MVKNIALKKNLINLLFFLIKSAIVIVISAAIGFVLMLAVYSIPVQNIDKNVEKSMSIFRTEKTYHNLVSWMTSNLDNWTDARMLAIASYNDDKHTLIEKSLLNFSRSCKPNPHECIVRYYDNKSFDYISQYARYWHGYLIFLKPMMYFTDLHMIRYCNLILHTILIMLICFRFWKDNLKELIPIFVLTLCSIMPVANAIALQYATCMYITLFSTLLLLLGNRYLIDKNRYLFLFLLIGISTSYFDFLTYPTLTYSIPMAIMVYINIKFNINNVFKSNKLTLFFTIKGFISWFIGYVGMWSMKWIITSLLTDNNIICSTIKTIAFRTSTSTGKIDFTYLDVIVRNIYKYTNSPIFYLIIIYSIFLSIYSIKKVGLINFATNFTVSISKFIFIIITPMLWYFMASNHSYVHNWMTYKILAIIPFAFMCALIYHNKKEEK